MAIYERLQLPKIRPSAKSSYLIAGLLLYLGVIVATTAAPTTNSIQPVTRLAEILGVAREVTNIRFSPDGKKIFAHRSSGTSIIWEPTKSGNFQNAQCSIVFGNGDRCVKWGAGFGGVVKVIEISTSNELYSMNTPRNDPPTDVVVSPRGSYIAVVTAIDGMTLFESKQGTPIATLASKWGFEDVLFSEDESVLVTRGPDLVVYDFKRRKETKINVSDIRSFVISQNGSLLWTASGFEDPQVLTITGKRLSGKFPNAFFDRYSYSVFGQFMDADSKVAMRTGLDNVAVWNWKSGAFAEMPTKAKHIATSEKGVLTVTEDGVMELWDRNIKKMVTFEGSMKLGVMTSDGTYICTVSHGGSLALWEVRW